MGANSFDEILNAVSDDNDRLAITDLASKYPDIKRGWLRQDDYSRKMDSFKDTEKEVGQWRSWAENNWDFEAGLPKHEKLWMERAQTLEQQLEGNMNFDQIKDFTSKFLDEKGVVTKTELEERAKDVDKGFQGSAYFAATLNELQGNYSHEFGKPLKTREFISKLNEFGTNDLDAAYARYVAEDRTKIQEQRTKDREADIRREATEAAEKEFMAKRFTQSGLPVDQNDTGLGHLQQKMTHAGEPDAYDKAELGKGSLGAIAAAEYLKKLNGTA